MALSQHPTANQPKIREPLKDYLEAVNSQIAERESVGAGATPYLVVQKAELEAALGLTKPEVKPEAVERKDAEPAPERAVPDAPERAVPEPQRRPGRPKKDVDDAAAGS